MYSISVMLRPLLRLFHDVPLSGLRKTPPSFPIYTTAGSAGLNAIACWSGWMLSPALLAEIGDQDHVPPAKSPRYASTPPTYKTFGSFGATPAIQSYQA